MLQRLKLWCSFMLVAAMAASCLRGPRFTTELTATRGLRAGDPVKYEGEQIGEVTDVKSLATGNYQVTFAVKPDRVGAVKTDSIAALRDDGGIHIDIVTREASGSPAPPNAQLQGAANAAEEALREGHNQLKGLAGGLEQMLNQLNSSIESINKSPVWDQFHKDLDDLQKQVQQAGEQGTEILNREIPKLQNELNRLKEQLLAQGKSDEARRLQKQLDDLVNNLSHGPTPTPTRGVD